MDKSKLFLLILPENKEIQIPFEVTTNTEVYNYVKEFSDQDLILHYNSIPIPPEPVVRLIDIGYNPYEFLVLHPFTTKTINFEISNFNYVFTETIKSYQNIFDIKEILAQRFLTISQNIIIKDSTHILSDDLNIADLDDSLTIDVTDGNSLFRIYFNNYLFVCLPTNSTLKNVKETLAGYNQLFERGIRYGPNLTKALSGVAKPDDQKIEKFAKDKLVLDFKYQSNNIKMAALINVETDGKTVYRYQGQYPYFPLKTAQTDDVINATKCFLEKQTQIQRDFFNYTEKLNFLIEDSFSVTIDDQKKTFQCSLTIGDLREIYGSNVGIVINDRFVTQEADFLLKYVNKETTIKIVRPKIESRLCEVQSFLSEQNKMKPFSFIIPVNLSFEQIDKIYLNRDQNPSQFFSIEDSKNPIEKTSKLENCLFTQFRALPLKEFIITYQLEGVEDEDTVSLDSASQPRIKDLLLKVSKNCNKPFQTFTAFAGDKCIDFWEPVAQFFDRSIMIITDEYQSEIDEEKDKYLKIYNEMKGTFITFKESIENATVDAIIKFIKQQDKSIGSVSLFLNFHQLSPEDKPILLLSEENDILILAENVKKQTFEVSNTYGISKSMTVSQNYFNNLASLILNDFSLTDEKVRFILKPKEKWNLPLDKYELTSEFDGGSLPKNSIIELKYELSESNEFTFSYKGENKKIKLKKRSTAISLQKEELFKKLGIFDLNPKAAEFEFVENRLDQTKSFSSFGIPSKAPISIIQIENTIKITVNLFDGTKIGDYFFKSGLEQCLIRDVKKQLLSQFGIDEKKYELKIYNENKSKSSPLEDIFQIEKNETLYASFQKVKVILFELKGEIVEIDEIVKPSETLMKLFYRKSKRLNDKLSLYTCEENGHYTPIDVKSNNKTFREFENKNFIVLRDVQDFIFAFQGTDIHLTQPFIPEIETVKFLIDKYISDMILVPLDQIQLVFKNQNIDESENIINLINDKKKVSVELKDFQNVPQIRNRQMFACEIEKPKIGIKKFRPKTIAFPKEFNPIQSLVLDNLKDETKEDEDEEQNEDNKNVFVGEDEEAFFELIEKIHEGSISSLFKVKDTGNDIIMCKKVIRIRSNSEFNDLKNSTKEFEILNFVNHPCICKLIGFNPVELISNEMNEEITTVALFLEYLDYKLIDYLKEIKNDFTKKAKIVLEIAHVMTYLHSKGLIYCDLNIDNVMIDSDFNVKLIDFEHAQMKKYIDVQTSIMKDKMSRCFGTLAFLSPEIANEEEFDYKTDVYSFGILVYFIFTGCFPEQKLKDKLCGKQFQMPKESDSISKFCINLIAKCIAFQPSKRPTFKEILNDIRMHNYSLAKNVDEKYLAKRDLELVEYIKK